MTFRTQGRRGRLFAAAAAIAATAAMLLSACSGTSNTDSTPGAEKGTLTIATAAPPGSLDPSKSGGTGVLFQLPAYGTLLYTPGVGEAPEPSLAESYEWVGDGPPVKLQMKLRSGLKFSDGTVMDSAAVKASIEHFAAGNNPAAGSAKPIVSMDTPDDLTIVFNLSAPTPTFLYDLSDATATGMGSIISPKALAGDIEALGTSTAGAGPYVLSANGTVEGSEYHYVPNEYYYDPDGIQYKEVIIKIIADPNTSLAAVQSGQVDVTFGFSDTYQRAQDAGVQTKLFNTTITGFWLSDWNGKNVPALADVRVRQAINMAVDRDAIAEAATHGLGQSTLQAAPVDSIGYDADLEDTYTYDPDEAKKLLAEAGYPDGFSMPIILRGFVPTFVIAAQAMAAQLAEVGIDVQLTVATTTSEFIAGASSGTYAGTVDNSLLPAGTPSAYSLLYSPTGVRNQQRIELPDMVEAAGAAASLPAEEATPAWQSVNEIAVEQAYSVPIASEPAIVYYGDSVKDVGANGLVNVVYVTPAS